MALRFDIESGKFVDDNNNDVVVNTVLNGVIAPDNTIGSNGDFYIDTKLMLFYGPKDNEWPAPVSIIGAPGRDGSDGVNGKDGRDGLPGKDGANGLPGANGENGADGRDGAQGKDGRDGLDVDMRSTDTHVQFRIGGGEWKNLFAIPKNKTLAGGGGRTLATIQKAIDDALAGFSVAHNATTGKQGGTTNQYYHLTSAEYTALQAGYVPLTRTLTANSPITGGGDLSANRSFGFDFSVANTWTGIQKFLNGTSQGEIRLGEATTNGSEYFFFRAPASMTANIGYILPSTLPSSTSFAKVSSSGTISHSRGSVGNTGEVQLATSTGFATAGAFNGGPGFNANTSTGTVTFQNYDDASDMHQYWDSAGNMIGYMTYDCVFHPSAIVLGQGGYLSAAWVIGGQPYEFSTTDISNTFYIGPDVEQFGATTGCITAIRAGRGSTSAELSLDGVNHISTFAGSLVNTASSALTTDGGSWNDSTQKTRAVYQAGMRQDLVGCIFTQTANASVSNTTTETSILGTGGGIKTIPANALVAEKTIRICIKGLLADSGSFPTLTVKVKLGSTTLVTMGGGSIQTNNTGFDFEYDITCRSTGGSGTVFGQGRFYYDTALSPTLGFLGGVSTTTSTIDTTAAQAIDVTAQWSAASSSNFIISTNATIEILK